jgi:hypothetical protein
VWLNKPSFAFYDFQPAHKQHIRTPIPIDWTFAKEPLKTAKIHECDAHRPILTMVSRSGMGAEKKWRKRRVLKGLPRFSGKSNAKMGYLSLLCEKMNSTGPSLKGFPKADLHTTHLSVESISLTLCSFF